MKKTFIYMSMAAFALASCSQNETMEIPMGGNSNPNEISFNSSTGTTRAVSNNLTALQNSAGFTVMGFKANNGTAFIDGTTTNAIYKFTDFEWGWAKSGGYQWTDVSAEYPMTFYAEYPQVDIAQSLNKDITMNLAMDKQVDYLVAQTKVNKIPTSGFAPLNFKHILSNIVFKVATRKDYKVYVQSIRIVNTAKKGRTFTYDGLKYEITEPDYQTADYAASRGTGTSGDNGFLYTGANVWSLMGSTGALVGTIPTAETDGIMMQMPQLKIPYWVADRVTDALAVFQADAAKWTAGNETNRVAKVDAWYTAAVATPEQPGMSDSKGWEGARIEVIYRIEDHTANPKKSIVGRYSGEAYTANGTPTTASGDKFVRVGYPLDLSAIKVANTPAGWEMNKRYTYTIQLGTASATNGILLDPDYKDESGESTNPKVPVDNPSTAEPGKPITLGTINFTVSVDEWTENNSDFPIN